MLQVSTQRMDLRSIDFFPVVFLWLLPGHTWYQHKQTEESDDGHKYVDHDSSSKFVPFDTLFFVSTFSLWSCYWSRKRKSSFFIPAFVMQRRRVSKKNYMLHGARREREKKSGCRREEERQRKPFLLSLSVFFCSLLSLTQARIELELLVAIHSVYDGRVFVPSPFTQASRIEEPMSWLLVLSLLLLLEAWYFERGERMKNGKRNEEEEAWQTKEERNRGKGGGNEGEGRQWADDGA